MNEKEQQPEKQACDMHGVMGSRFSKYSLGRAL